MATKKIGRHIEVNMYNYVTMCTVEQETHT